MEPKMNAILYRSVASLCLCILASLVSMHNANAVLAETATVAASAEILKAEANEIIDTAANRFDWSAMRAANEARGLIEQWQVANKDLVDHSFKSLDGSQRVFFENLDAALQNLRKDLVDPTTDHAQKSVDQVDQLVRDLAWWSDHGPVVLRTSPSVLTPTKAKTITVRTMGHGLDVGPATMTIGAQTYSPVGVTPTELTFELPASSIPFSDASHQLQRATVTITRPNSAWYKRIFGSTEDVPLNIAFLKLPPSAGTYKVLYTTTETQHDVSAWKQREFSYRSASMNRDCQMQLQRPEPGWKIDVHSIKGAGEWGASGTYSMLPEWITPEGFSISICAQRRHAGFNWGPGEQHVIYKWQEYRDHDEPVQHSVDAKPLPWGSRPVEKLPDNTASFELTFEDFAGNSQAAVGTARLNYAQISYTKDTKQLTIEPKAPSNW